jgi:hypothetical protein
LAFGLGLPKYVKVAVRVASTKVVYESDPVVRSGVSKPND